MVAIHEQVLRTKAPTVTRTGVLRRQTRRAGQFELVVSLPGDIDPNRVEASLRDGVLTVRVGKAAASQPRQIEVKPS
jgi:HSP20 family protein